MEPVYCPNGHPNRPGTRICAVCRALVAPSSPATAPPPTAPPPAQQPRPAPPQPAPAPPVVEPETPPVESAPARGRSRLWLWLLLFLLLAALAVAVLLAMFYPLQRSTAAQPTAVATTIPAAAVEPTSTEAIPTSTPPQPAEAAAIEPDSPTPVATITPLDTIVGVVITPTFVFEPGANLLQNGEFAEDWVNGWARETDGAGVVEVRPLEGEPGITELHMESSGPGLEQIGQRVVLTTPIEGLVFRARVRQSGVWRADGDEGRSALILRYENAAGEPLGASIWLDGSAETTGLLGSGPLPAPGPTVIVRHTDEGRQSLEVDLSRELAEELPAIDPVAVRQITVLLVLLGGDACGPDDCAAALDAVGLSLSAGG